MNHVANRAGEITAFLLAESWRRFRSVQGQLTERTPAVAHDCIEHVVRVERPQDLLVIITGFERRVWSKGNDAVLARSALNELLAKAMLGTGVIAFKVSTHQRRRQQLLGKEIRHVARFVDPKE